MINADFFLPFFEQNFYFVAKRFWTPWHLKCHPISLQGKNKESYSVI